MSNIDSAAQEIEDLLTRGPASVKLGHTSDNVVDEKFKSFFEVMRPDRLTFLYEKWKQCHWRAGSKCQELPWLQDPDATAAHTELRGLQWGAIYDAAKRVENLAGVGENLRLASSAAITELDAAWKGKAADAAQEKFTEIKTASGDFKDVTTKLSANVLGLWSTTTEAVNALCKLADNPVITNFVAKYGVDGYMPDGHGTDWYAYIEPAFAQASSDGTRGDWSRIMDHYLTFSSQAEIEAEDPDDWPAWTQIFDDFCVAYNDAVGLFRKGLYTAHRTVENALQSFHQEVSWMAAEYDPFAKIAPPDSGSGSDGGGKDKPGSRAPREQSPGGRQSGGTPGGSTMAGGASTPSVPSASTGVDVSAPADERPEVQPGTNPVTGKPLEVDPETGKAYPIDPETGEPIKDGGSDVDTTTVRKGDSEISITEPSSDGKMSVSVDDGTGKPKDYELDFGNEKDSKDGEAAGGAGGFGPHGAKDAGKGGAGGSEDVHTPDEDGKIRIEDGDLKIVAEQPMGPDGATVVTIDDGKGEPTSYLLGDEEAVEEFNERLDEDKSRLVQAREGLEARGDDVSKQEWDELKKAETEFGERGGRLDAFDDGPKGGGSGVGSGVGGGGGAGSSAGVGSTAPLEAGARSGVGVPQGVGGPGLGTTPGGESSAAAASAGQSGRGGMGGGMGGGMMGGMGGGAGGGGDERSSSSQYQVHGSGIFEPDLQEGPFGVARISGSIDDDET